MGNAIVARMGLDLAPIKADLQAASQLVSQSGDRMAAGFHKGAEGSEHLLASSHRVAHQVTNVAKSLVDGGSAASVFSAGLEGVARSMHLSLGALAALEVGSVLIEGLAKTKEEAEKLQAEFLKLTAAKISPDFSGLDAIDERLKESSKALEEYRAKFETQGKTGLRNFVQDVQNKVGDLLAGGDSDTYYARKREMREGFQGAKDSSVIAATGKMSEANDISEGKQNGDSLSAEIRAINAKTNEKAGKIAERYGKDDPNGLAVKAIAQVKREGDIERENAESKHAAQERALGLEASLLYLKTQGANEEVRAAEARLRAAEETLAEGGNDREREAAKIAVDAAKEQLSVTQRTVSLKHQQQAVDIETASFVGTADEKRTLELQRQLEILQAQRATAKEDQRAEIDAAIARNEEQSRQLAFSKSEKGFQRFDIGIDATTGEGASEKLTGARRHLKNAKSHLDSLNNTDGVDPNQIAEAKEKVHSLQMSIADMEREWDTANETAKTQAEILQAQETGHISLAKQLEIELKYRERIAQANRDGNAELAAQLQTQQTLEIHAQRVAEYMKSPEQRRKDHEAARKADRDSKAYDRQVDDVRGAMARGVTDFGHGARGQIADDIRHGLDPNDHKGPVSEFKAALSGTEDLLKNTNKILASKFVAQ